MGGPFAQILIITNPASGGKEPVLHTLNHVFHEHGIQWDVVLTHKSGDGRELAQEAVAAGVDLVTSILPDDGALDVIVINNISRSIFAIAANIVRRKKLSVSLQHWPARDVTVVAEPPQAVQVDGDLFGQTPITATILPQVLRVLVPGGNASRAVMRAGR